MKTTTTIIRNSVLAILFTFTFTNAFSNNDPISNTIVTNLKATIQNNNLVINWNVAENVSTDYCMVQVSNDGITFTTIGMVMGADPKQTNNGFAFKQDLSKMKPGHKYYRVISLETNVKGHTSNVVKAL